MKYVCARCGRPCGWWAKGDGGYWKHQNGGWKAKPTCGQPAQPVRVAELQFSPAMRSALREVRIRMSRGESQGDAVKATARLRGFMVHEVRKAYEISEVKAE